MIRAELINARELKASLGQVSPAIQTKLRILVADNLLQLRDGVKSNIERMFRTSGFAKFVQAEMEESPGTFTGTVWIDGKQVPYAKIQEEGGQTRPHTIFAKRGKALAFMMKGGGGGGPGAWKMGFSGGDVSNALVLVKKVNHPGSRITSRPYARLALAKQKPIFQNGVRFIVMQALEPMEGFGL